MAFLQVDLGRAEKRRRLRCIPVHHFYPVNGRRNLTVNNVARFRRVDSLRAVAFEKHLLVDGSNLLHAWPELRKWEKRDREAARSRLSETVRLLHDFEQCRVTLVFDGKGTETIVEHPSGHETFTHIFSPAQLTGDDVIEHLVGQAPDPSQCWVATDDRAERQTVDALGGTSLSAAELAEWVARTEAKQRLKLSGLARRNDQEWRRK